MTITRNSSSTGKRYSTIDIKNVIKDSQNGLTMIGASEKHGIQYCSLKQKVNKVKTNEEDCCPGPKPILGVAMEDDLHYWIVELQKIGRPIPQGGILIKGKTIFYQVYRHFEQGGDIGKIGQGWIEKFEIIPRFKHMLYSNYKESLE